MTPPADAHQTTPHTVWWGWKTDRWNPVALEAILRAVPASPPAPLSPEAVAALKAALGGSGAA